MFGCEIYAIKISDIQMLFLSTIFFRCETRENSSIAIHIQRVLAITSLVRMKFVIDISVCDLRVHDLRSDKY